MYLGKPVETTSDIQQYLILLHTWNMRHTLIVWSLLSLIVLYSSLSLPDINQLLRCCFISKDYNDIGLRKLGCVRVKRFQYSNPSSFKDTLESTSLYSASGPLEPGITRYLINIIGCPLSVIVYRCFNRESIDRWNRLITTMFVP